MGEQSKIEWTHHTFNPWWGCTKVSPGCDNCYAEAFDKRVGGKHWGKDATRRLFGDKHWNEPRKWNRLAEAAGERHRVFCASMADVFDADPPEGQRERLWALIRETPRLDWLLLTKRHGRIRMCLPSDWGNGYPNVWLGVSVDDRTHGLPRIDLLRGIPARVRFLSVEPLLEDLGDVTLSGIHWVIIGGESGHGARRFDPAWARSLVRQCREQGVSPFVKQMGAKVAEKVPMLGGGHEGKDLLTEMSSAARRPWDGWTTVVTATERFKARPWKLKDAKGGDWNEWPEDLRVREFPGGREENP